MKFTHIRNKEGKKDINFTNKVKQVISKKLNAMGFNYDIDKQTSTGFTIREIRVNTNKLPTRYYMKNLIWQRGQNPRRCNYPSWSDYVDINNAINHVLDKLKASCTVKSQCFKIRSNGSSYLTDIKYDESDWENQCSGDQYNYYLNRVKRFSELSSEEQNLFRPKFKKKKKFNGKRIARKKRGSGNSRTTIINNNKIVDL